MEGQTQEELVSEDNLTCEGIRRKKSPSDIETITCHLPQADQCAVSAHHGYFERLLLDLLLSM